MVKKIFIGLAVAIAAASIGLHFFLTHRLNAYIQRVAVPAARERLQADVSAGDAGVDFIAGAVVLPDIRIGNPPGFTGPSALSVGRTRIGFSRRSLLRGRTRIASLELQDARIAVIRDAAGRVNMRELAAADTSRQAAPGAGSPSTPFASSGGEAASPSSLPPPVRALPDHIRMTGVATYIDHSTNAPVRVDMALVIAADGLSASGDAAATGGTFTIRGHLASAPDAMITDLCGRIAPLANPAKPSFDLSGKIASIDPTLISPLTERTGFACDPFTVDVKAICREGVFDEAQSSLTLHLKNVRLSSRKARHGLVATLSGVTVPLPLGGTLQEPRVQWETALPTALLQGAGNDLASVVAPLGVKSNDVDKILKALGGRWPKVKSK